MVYRGGGVSCALGNLAARVCWWVCEMRFRGGEIFPTESLLVCVLGWGRGPRVFAMWIGFGAMAV